MKLSMSLLAKYLRKYDTEVHILEDGLSIKGIRFLSDQRSSYSLDYVYVGEASGYIQDPRYRDALILVCGENQIICHSSDYEMLINDILAAFDYYGGLEERLIMAAGEHKPLEVMMDAATGILDSPMLVFDMEGDLIYSVHEELLTENIVERSQTSQSISLESISQMLIDEQGRVHHDITDHPLLLRSTQGASEVGISMYLCLEGERVGFIMIFPVSENETRIGMHCENMLAQYFCKAMEFTDRSSVYLSGTQVFKRLLSGEQPSESVLKRFCKELEAEFPLLLLVLRNHGVQNYTIHHLIINEVKMLGSKCVACEYQNTVAILIDKALKNKIVTLLKRGKWISNLSVGISMPVYHVDELCIAYKQAYLAMTGEENPGMRECKDYALNCLLRQLKEDDFVLYLRHPAINVLNNYDNVNNTELLKTLDAYLQHSCSQNQTAEFLHIHLNSLKYRLRRIAEISDIDFKNSEEMFYLQLSLRI